MKNRLKPSEGSMQEGDSPSDTQRVHDGESFRRRKQELLERQQRRRELEAERRLIAAAIGVDDDEIVLDLEAVGYRPDTIVLLELVPPVQVAWADGRVTERERELFVTIAAREHVAPNSPARTQLEIWLDRPPSHLLFDTSLRAIAGILSSLQTEVRASLRRKLIHDCTMIAVESSGLFGWHFVWNEEQQAIARIVRELS